MGEIIVLEKKRAERKESWNINDWLRESADMLGDSRLPLDNSIACAGSVKHRVEQLLMRRVFDLKMIESDVCLCVSYIAGLVAELKTGDIEEWYLVDHWPSGKDDLPKYKSAADTCFMICAFFSKRATRRSIAAGYYQQAGKSLYWNFYGLSGKVIGHHMSRRFEFMKSLVSSAFSVA